MDYIIPTINGSGRLGHQFTQMVAAFGIGRKYDLKYIYSPFRGDQHEWNKVFKIDGVPNGPIANLPKVIIPKSISVMEKANTKKLEEIINNNRNRNCIFVCALDLFMKIDWESFKTLGDIYRAKRQKRKTVAVHIRRGDIYPNSNANRWLTIDYYCKVLEGIREVDPEIPIHIHSDGNIRSHQNTRTSNFERLNKYNVTFYVEKNPIEAMHDLINASVLVTSKSNFCTIASYASTSTNLKLSINFNPYWCDFPADRTDICQVSDNGDFDKETLARHLCI